MYLLKRHSRDEWLDNDGHPTPHKWAAKRHLHFQDAVNYTMALPHYVSELYAIQPETDDAPNDGA